jgi:hypothetical protein
MPLTNRIRIIPATGKAPDSVFDFLNVFKFSNISDDSFFSNASSVEKIIVRDGDTLEVISSYVDSDYNNTLREGRIWWRGEASDEKSFIIDVSTHSNITNGNSVFSGFVNSHGYDNAVGDSIDRCGSGSARSTTVERSASGAIGKAFDLTEFGDKIEFMNDEDVSSPIVLNGAPKVTLHFLVRRSEVSTQNSTCLFSAVWGDFYFMFFNKYFIGSTDVSVFDATCDVSSQFTVNEYSLVSVVFDGTATDADLDIQDAKRFMVFVNGTKMNIVFDLWDGHVPSTFMSVSSPFLYTLLYAFAGTYSGAIDEDLFLADVDSATEILLRANQMVSNSSYWSVSCVPVITNARRIDPILISLFGSGFSPSGDKPIVTINGVSTVVSDGYTNTSMTIAATANRSHNGVIISVENSNNESCSYTLRTNNKFSSLTTGVL